MKSTAVVTTPDPGVEALIREARRHQRRRYAATGAAVAAARRAVPSSSGAEGFAVSPRLVAFGTDCANLSTAQSLN